MSGPVAHLVIRKPDRRQKLLGVGMTAVFFRNVKGDFMDISTVSASSEAQVPIPHYVRSSDYSRIFTLVPVPKRTKNSRAYRTSGKREREWIAPHQHFSNFAAMLFLLLRNMLQQFDDVGNVRLDTSQLLCKMIGAAIFVI